MRRNSHLQVVYLRSLALLNKNPPLPLRHEQHMFKFMIAFASCFTHIKKDRRWTLNSNYVYKCVVLCSTNENLMTKYLSVEAVRFLEIVPGRVLTISSLLSEQDLKKPPLRAILGGRFASAGWGLEASSEISFIDWSLGLEFTDLCFGDGGEVVLLSLSHAQFEYPSQRSLLQVPASCVRDVQTCKDQEFSSPVSFKSKPAQAQCLWWNLEQELCHTPPSWHASSSDFSNWRQRYLRHGGSCCHIRGLLYHVALPQKLPKYTSILTHELFTECQEVNRL